jgi:hypothetical protein
MASQGKDDDAHEMALLEERETSITAAKFDLLALQLRSWAPLIREAAAAARQQMDVVHDGDSEAEGLHDPTIALAGWVAWLDTSSDIVDEGVSFRLRSRGKKFKYRLGTLIKCFLLSRHVRCRSNIQNVLMHALQMVVPKPILQGLIAERLEAAPTKSCMSRLCLRIDAAYMLWRRTRYPPGSHCIFAKVDASNQGGREWLMQNYTFCRWEALESVAEASDELISITEDIFSNTSFI